LKHLNLVTRRPQQASNEFTTGQKLTLFAGIAQAVSTFYAAKENPTTEESTSN
jgi:hypothetical protein